MCLCFYYNFNFFYDLHGTRIYFTMEIFLCRIERIFFSASDDMEYYIVGADNHKFISKFFMAHILMWEISCSINLLILPLHTNFPPFSHSYLQRCLSSTQKYENNHQQEEMKRWWFSSLLIIHYFPYYANHSIKLVWNGIN